MRPYRPIYDPQLWRARAQATRIKADSLGPGQPRDRLLKVADEYDKLANTQKGVARAEPTKSQVRVTISDRYPFS